MRVITTVTAAVAAKPSQVSSCFAVPPAGAPEASCVTLVMSDPRYTYIAVPGTMPTSEPTA